VLGNTCRGGQVPPAASPGRPAPPQPLRNPDVCEVLRVAYPGHYWKCLTPCCFWIGSRLVVIVATHVAFRHDSLLGTPWRTARTGCQSAAVARDATRGGPRTGKTRPCRPAGRRGAGPARSVDGDLPLHREGMEAAVVVITAGLREVDAD